MSEQFKLHISIQDYLDEYYDKEKGLADKDREGFLLQVARRVQYDASFEKGLLKNTTDYIEHHYPNIKLWDDDDGTLPEIPQAATKEQLESLFDGQILYLKKNFSHERVDWLEKVGKRLYGTKVGEPQGQRRTTDQSLKISRTRQQEENSKRNYRETTNQTSHISGSKIAIAIVILLAIVMLFLKD